MVGAKLRILLIGPGILPIPPRGYGGVERFLGELIQALRSRGQEVVLLNKTIVHRPSHVFRSWWPFNDVQALWNGLHAPGFMRALRPDVVHVSTWHAAVELAALNLPYVYTENHADWRRLALSGRSVRLRYSPELMALRHAAGVIGATTPLCAAMQTALGNEGKVHCIPHGVDTRRFTPHRAVGDGEVALGIGVVDPRKRWDLAAEAFVGTRIRLRIAGPVTHKEYANHLRRTGNTTLLGEISDDELVDQVEGAGFLVHPSRSETFGIAVVEALAGGRPVIGCSEVASLLDHGETGFVVPDRSLSRGEVVHAIREYGLHLSRDQDLRKTMGQAAREAALKRYSWDAVVDSHVQLFHQVVKLYGKPYVG